MNILEKEIEDVVWNCIQYNPELLIERGLPIRPNQAFQRQVQLGDYGIADLIGVEFIPEAHVANVTIFELKKEKVGTQTLLQAARYAKALSESNSKGSQLTLYFHFILIGKGVELGTNFVYLADFVDNLSVVTYSIDIIQGIKFHVEKNYSMTKAVVPNFDFTISQTESVF